jgi:transcriptional regulator with XRE-family HTH domain
MEVDVQKLKALRERSVLSREELAEGAGLNYETVRRIEAGDQEPRPKTIRALARALGVEPHELLKGGDDA